MAEPLEDPQAGDLKVSVRDDAVLALIARYREQIGADVDEQSQWLAELGTPEAREVARRILGLPAGKSSSVQTERFAQRVLAAS